MRRAAAVAGLLAVLGALPFTLSFSQQEILVFLVINVLLVSSYRLLTLTGEWSLIHVVMMGVGAYTSALLAKELGVPVPAAMALGSAAAGLVALVLSVPLFRMRGFYFLIGSFAAGEIIRLLWKRFRDPFGGPKGIKRIPGLEDIEVGGLTIDFFEPVNYYFFALAVVSASLWVLWRIERSAIGLTFHAIHWQSRLAESVGVDSRLYRTLAFTVASFFAGLSGALLAHYVGTVNPNSFNVETMVFVLTWCIVGGAAHFLGPIAGTVVFTVVNEIVLRELGHDQLRPLFYGVLLMLSVLLLPDGLASLVPRARALAARARRGGT